jgi:hypothetical protein
VRKLDLGGLDERQVKLLLEMLVHHVNHPIAKAPKQKQGADKEKGNEKALAVLGGENGVFVHGLYSSLSKPTS